MNQRPSPRGDADGQWLHDKAPTGPRADSNGTGRPRNPAVPASAIAMNTRLAVSNLHYEITPKDLTVCPFFPSANVLFSLLSISRPSLDR